MQTSRTASGQTLITGSARGACVLVSLGCLIAGVFATFKTDNEFGTTALLLVGVFAGLVALLQRVPRIKWGDNEMDPNELLDNVEDLAETAGDKAQELANRKASPQEIGRGTREAVEVRALKEILARWAEGQDQTNARRSGHPSRAGGSWRFRLDPETGTLTRMPDPEQPEAEGESPDESEEPDKP